MNAWARFLLTGESEEVRSKLEAFGARWSKVLLSQRLAWQVGRVGALLLYYGTAPFPPLRRQLYMWCTREPP
jgi:hypothetical protein